MSDITLTVEPATAEAVAPYGTLIGPGSGATARTSPFYDGAVETSRPADFVSDDDTAISLCKVQPRDARLAYFERHHKHSQVFVPLSGRPFVGVFAAATDGEEPDWTSLKAFRFDGQDAFCMHVGTWHEFPFALEPDTHMLVVLRNETNANLANIAGGEARGPDLDKLNVVQRTGREYRVAI